MNFSSLAGILASAASFAALARAKTSSAAAMRASQAATASFCLAAAAKRTAAKGSLVSSISLFMRLASPTVFALFLHGGAKSRSIWSRRCFSPALQYSSNIWRMASRFSSVSRSQPSRWRL